MLLRVTVPLPVPVCDGVQLCVPLADSDGVLVSDAVALGVCDKLPLPLGDVDGVAVLLAVGDGVPLALGDPLRDCELEPVALGVCDDVSDKLVVCEGLDAWLGVGEQTSLRPFKSTPGQLGSRVHVVPPSVERSSAAATPRCGSGCPWEAKVIESCHATGDDAGDAAPIVKRKACDTSVSATKVLGRRTSMYCTEHAGNFDSAKVTSRTCTCLW